MTSRSLRRVLDAIDSLEHADNPANAAHAVLDAAIHAVGADTGQLTRLDHAGATLWSRPAGFLSNHQRSAFEALHAARPWPLATHTRTGPGVALRISDVWSVRQYRASPMYAEFFRQLSVRHQVAFSVPAGAHHALCVTLQRDGTDFTDSECGVINALRPCLALAARRPFAVAALPAGGDALTSREHDILRLAAGGLSDLQIAHRLGISRHTVSKHLQHVYRKTGTTNRTQAALRAGQLGTPYLAGTDAFAGAAPATGTR